MNGNHCGVCTGTTDGYLCGNCTRDLRTTLAGGKQEPSLASLLAELAVAVSRQTRVYRANATPRPTEREAWQQGDYALRPTPLPVNLDAADLAHAANNTLTTWARHLAESRGTDLDREPLPFLVTYVQSFRWDEAGPEAHVELTALRERVIRAVDRSPSPVFAGPCHALTLLTDTDVRDGTIYARTYTGPCTADLYASARVFDAEWLATKAAGAEPVTITCRTCNAVHDVIERRSFLVKSIEDALLPMSLLRAATKGKRPLIELEWPKDATIRSWVHRKQLAERGKDRSGVLFRGGDVLDLVRDWNDRQQGRGRRTA